MAAIHTRVPVILPRMEWAVWFGRDVEKRPPVHLLCPFDSQAMQALPCNASVGYVKNNGPEMLLCPAADSPACNSA